MLPSAAMTARRTPGFDLGQALADPGFTPRAADVPALLDRVAAGGDDALPAERALGRVGLGAGIAAAERAEHAEGVARARLTKLAGRFAAGEGGEALGPFLIARLGDRDERTRRAAATAIGKARPEGAEAALVAALDRAASETERRALVEALGKVGGEAARAALGREGAAEPGSAQAKALLMTERIAARATPAAIDGTRPSPGPLPVVLRCREGLGRFVIDELSPDLRARMVQRPLGGPRIEATLTGPLARLLEARTMLWFAFPLPEVKLRRDEDPAPAIAAALTSDAAIRIFRTWTVLSEAGAAGDPPVRYRLAWAAGGKRRARTWRAASEVAARAKTAGIDLVNDPTASLWDVIVYEAVGALRIEISPRLADPRFAYRLGDVPAASHPTIAAALVRAGGVLPGDVVWDPFVGSGTELCERALAGPYRMLMGTDRDAAAIAVARQNLAAAGARDPVLMVGDATALALPARPTLIVTNPPLGRRVERTPELAPMLDKLIDRAARSLVKGGRMAWIAPFPERSDAIAARGGLTVELAEDVDLGGFTARLQVLRRPA
jgi:predicted RNA methylase